MLAGPASGAILFLCAAGCVPTTESSEASRIRRDSFVEIQNDRDTPIIVTATVASGANDSSIRARGRTLELAAHDDVILPVEDERLVRVTVAVHGLPVHAPLVEHRCSIGGSRRAPRRIPDATLCGMIRKSVRKHALRDIGAEKQGLEHRLSRPFEERIALAF